MARILGRERVAQRLRFPAGELPVRPTPEQTRALREMAAQEAERVARALLEEAAACDDVTDAASALSYLEDRLAFLGELLDEGTRERVRRRFAAVARGWG